MATQASKLIKVLKTRSHNIKTSRELPKELFRIASGSSVSLRDRAVSGTGCYDLVLEGGMVKPRALDPNTYTAPNGASMRPNSFRQRQKVKRIKSPNSIVCAVKADTKLPSDLILVDEHRGHYSLQAARDMTLTDLNKKLSDFFEDHGKIFTKQEWLAAYPRPTKPV